jgi:hypothetical protein
MMQGVAIVLEGVFETVTGRRVGGRLGTLWMCLFVVTLGQALRDSWYVSPLASLLEDYRHKQPKTMSADMCRRRQDPARSLARSPARAVLVVAAVRDTDGVSAASAALDELAPRILLRRAGTRELPVAAAPCFAPTLCLCIFAISTCGAPPIDMAKSSYVTAVAEDTHRFKVCREGAAFADGERLVGSTKGKSPCLVVARD